MASIKPVNSQVHKQTCIKRDNRFVTAKGQHLIPLFVSEFEAASAEFPIVFVKDHETGQIRSAVMTGLKPGENYFYSEAGWRAEYAPFALRTHPFQVVAGQEDKERLVVCIDEASELVSEQEGDALFTENGEESAYLKERGQFAAHAVQQTGLTEAFIKSLIDLKLIKSNNLEVKVSEDERYELSGLYIIDRERLQALSDQEFLSLREAGYLPAVFAALSSMNRINRLLRLKSAAAG